MKQYNFIEKTYFKMRDDEWAYAVIMATASVFELIVGDIVMYLPDNGVSHCSLANKIWHIIFLSYPIISMILFLLTSAINNKIDIKRGYLVTFSFTPVIPPLMLVNYFIFSFLVLIFSFICSVHTRISNFHSILSNFWHAKPKEIKAPSQIENVDIVDNGAFRTIPMTCKECGKYKD